MVLGFISLLLTFGQSYIAKICIPEAAGNTMLPCAAHVEHLEHHPPGHDPSGEHHAAGEHQPTAEHHPEPEHHEPEHHEPEHHEPEHPPPENEHKKPAEAAAEHHRRLLWSMRRVLSGHATEECKPVSMSEYSTLDLPSEVQLIKLVLCCIGVLRVEDFFVIYFSQHIFTERKFVPSYYLPDLNIVGKLKGIII